MSAVLDTCPPSILIERYAPATLLRLSGIVEESIVDGPGLRMAVFTQGCPHHCHGCHNPITHASTGGFASSAEEIVDRFDANPLLAGITLSGGEPLVQPEALLPIARQMRQRKKSVWCYTGYTFEQAMHMAYSNDSLLSLLHHIDVLVDGRYESSLRDLTLPYRGSTNQRLVDMPRSLAAGRVVTWSK